MVTGSLQSLQSGQRRRLQRLIPLLTPPSPTRRTEDTGRGETRTPAATLSVGPTPAVLVSSPSYGKVLPASHVCFGMKINGVAQRWTVQESILKTDMASAMKTAPPPSPALTSAHKIMDSTCVGRTA